MSLATPVSAPVSLSSEARETLETSGKPAQTKRDRTVDLVRAACLLAVVGVHALMVGVSVQGGTPVLENALEPWSGFTVFSWFAQMMPLFFILGGFASATHYRRLRSRGTSPSDYVATRLRRLLPVPLAAAGATVVALCGLALSGASPDIVATAGWRISQPLWFLGVYILCSALVPLMIKLHERAPRLTLLSLGLGIATVDALRFVTGIDAIGFANLLFVWLAVQQLGFWLADGRIPSARTAWFAVAGIVTLMAIGASPMNLFEALNPPTAALALLGVVQFKLFTVLRPKLAALAGNPKVSRVSDALNSHSMTVYSWHMPVVVLLAGLLLIAGPSLPIPLTPEWWLSRPVWLVAAGIAVVAVVAVAGRIERGPKKPSGVQATQPVTTRTASTTISAKRAAFSVLSGASGVLLILATTGSLWAWAAGAALMACGLLAARDPRHVVARNHLDARAPLGLTKAKLVLVQAVPALNRRIRNIARVQQRGHSIRVGGLGLPKLRAILKQALEGLHRIRLRVTDQADRATLNPTGRVHTRNLLALKIEHAALAVRDHTRRLIKWDLVER
ncbi:acyltransferase [Leucobacter viscericola]|uniref:Acyltransferase n=1 Tax=Leucobacter viscericola TaxID=2714935 RepID=A0A6G7XGR0_9MICO|nr:acyltransferase [Leucobacter viscericola]